ncbi:MAG: hypothetical protein AAGE84_29280 [Cyanobacteria bacterium P01_G01_bin.39]
MKPQHNYLLTFSVSAIAFICLYWEGDYEVSIEHRLTLDKITNQLVMV